MLNLPLHILLVEDDEIDAEAVLRAFHRQPFATTITHVKDGVEALAVLRGEATHALLARPYLILLDINLPRMNGLEFLQIIRQDPVLKASVVFMLTTSDQPADKEAAYNRQVAGYILKSKVGLDFASMRHFLAAYQRVVHLLV